MACGVCGHIERTERGENLGAVARTKSGYVILAECQYHHGYSYFTARTCAGELHELDPSERLLYLDEMATVAGCIHDAFRAKKMNYELLGNSAPHLHWHLIPRHSDDPQPQWPAWSDQHFIAALNEKTHRLSDDDLEAAKSALLTELERHDGLLEVAYR